MLCLCVEGDRKEQRSKLKNIYKFYAINKKIKYVNHTVSPIKAAKFGATLCILTLRYSINSLRRSIREFTLLAKTVTFSISRGDISIPKYKKIDII